MDVHKEDVMASYPRPQQIYKHFKGNLYQIVSLAEHSETGEMLVIYQALYGEFKIYARPLSMFLEKVDKEKYPQVTQEYRFELQGRTDFAGDKPEDECKANGQKAGTWTDAVKQEESSAVEQNVNFEEPEFVLDPLVLEFLDADSCEERLNILAALHHRITDDMINTMAIAIDVEVNEGDIEQRYDELKRCLLLFDKFESNRLR